MKQIMKRFFAFLPLLFLVFNLSACSKQDEKKEDEDQQVSSQLSPILSMQQNNDGIDFLLALENKSNHSVTLSFNSSKMFDISVKDSAGKEHFRHSKEKNYNQEAVKVEIRPGASHIWKAKWKLSPSERKAGIYKVDAELTPNEISPGSLKTEKLKVNDRLTLQSGTSDLKNHSFRNIHFTGSDGKYKVSGEARVFEASFAYSVTDGHEIFVESHEQTAEGAPAWAPFSFDITIASEDLPINGTLMLELFYFSPKDGEKTDLLAVPLQTFR
ncbi:hypothetical protein KUV80_06820 [Fictibacillus nanhaiensis]|uniref:BsuPI-related putative proteinase inhibitor n=1 Tax=Fictibacillus nanhaiensis TaxID=742169 RepID=UPI001C983979|nr:BsuPI-related putative proteinase inhibitor [Fictibacillus nanhaiensis]MBY6036357.1 hypothetical protein [Fictibacillus nanhaiensis]